MTDAGQRPKDRAAPRLAVSGPTARLWGLAALATTYVLVWWGFAPDPAAPATDGAPAEVAQPTASPPATVWWHDLPLAQRPVVAIPPGWELAPPGTAIASATPRAAPAPVRRARVRLRTRRLVMQELRAMDTTVTLHAPALAAAAEVALAAEVAATFADAERRFSRFRADSELARLNRAVGTTSVSPTMMAALVRARSYVLLTGGRFDPAIGGALVAAGYDRSFGDGAAGAPDARAHAVDAAARSMPVARFGDLEIDVPRGQVRRPPHLQLDLGGMIKGATVDQAARALPAIAALDAGGDIALRGAGPDGDGWLVDVEDPADPARVLLTLRVFDGAVATSAANRRRWRHGGGWAHHLIDPRAARRR